MVLAVVHNVTAATRLLDVLHLVAQDNRIQVEFTITGSSAFTAGTSRFLLDQGIQPRPWDVARKEPFDLVIAASHGGRLGRLAGPVMILPHGMGYNKFLKAEKPKSRKAEKPVFGLSPEWLIEDGELVPSVLVLSHPEQLARLARDCPEAAELAVLTGDPCFDRMLASQPLRPVYRRALGASDGRRLAVITSTWGPDSLYGRHPDLARRLAAELLLDDYRLVATLHPNVWHWHAPWQIRMWAEACRRAGVLLLPPGEGWRAALVAADVVVGDHGSVTFYGAALGRPTLLASAPRRAVAPDSAIGAFLRAASRLDHRRPLGAQLDSAIADHHHARELLRPITELTTSAPGSAMDLLRARFYDVLGLLEPDTPPEVNAVPIPADAAGEAGAQLIRVELGNDAGARITRHAAELLAVTRKLPAGTHLSVDLNEPHRRFLELAEIVVVPDAQDAAAVLRTLPGCLLATGPIDPRCWLVVCSDGQTLRFTGIANSGRVCASVVHAWLVAGRDLDQFPARMSLLLGRTAVSVDVVRPG